jgi:hypothetical protein
MIDLAGCCEKMGAWNVERSVRLTGPNEERM